MTSHNMVLKIKKVKIVILGAGFGGLQLARMLSRNSAYNVFLIDQRDFHIYYPVLYEVASSFPFYSEEELRLADSFYIPALLKGYAVTFVQAYSRGVDSAHKQVHTSIGPIAYDHLVVALGSDVNYYGIPGLKEHSMPLKSWNGILAFRKKLKDLVEAVSEGQVPIDIVVGGGGFSGVELACELAVTLKKEEKLFKLHKKDIRLKVIEAGPGLLAGLPASVGQRTMARLKKLGVEVILKSPIKRVDESSLYIQANPKAKEIKTPYNLLIWTGGVEGPSIARETGMQVDTCGRFMSDQFLHVSGQKDVWAIGDNACFIEPGQERPIPSQAYFALQQSAHVAINIRRALSGSALLPFKPVKKGFVIPLGGKYAIACLGDNVIIEGFLGWCIRKVVDLNYFRTLVGWARGFIFLAKQLVIFSTND